VDLDGNGTLDLLSGSYSRHSQDMAGLFQVLWGAEDGGFAKPEALQGTDGEPLILPGNERTITDKICTRAFAADLDGDGKLDLVSGNFAGTFFVFAGEGEGRFAPEATRLLGADGSALRVSAHSDPFLVDWDRDGDLDLLSGSAQGGVYLSVNGGDAKKPSFAKPVALVEPAGYPEGTRMGDDFLTGPQHSTRVWADDLNGDGKLDLLVGDSITLHYPVEGIDDATAAARYEAWQEKESELYDSYPADDDPEELEAFGLRRKALDEELETFLHVDVTGFVWVLHQK